MNYSTIGTQPKDCLFGRAHGLSTSCVQTTHTLCLCLGALTEAGGGERGVSAGVS